MPEHTAILIAQIYAFYPKPANFPTKTSQNFTPHCPFLKKVDSVLYIY